MAVSDWHRTENRQTTKMAEAIRKRVASSGGKALLEKYGREHFAEIGKKGGAKTSQDREHMAKIGRIGGSR